MFLADALPFDVRQVAYEAAEDTLPADLAGKVAAEYVQSLTSAPYNLPAFAKLQKIELVKADPKFQAALLKFIPRRPGSEGVFVSAFGQIKWMNVALAFGISVALIAVVLSARKSARA